MKLFRPIILLAALASTALAQPSLINSIGDGITNPAFREAVLNGTGVNSTELAYLNGLAGPLPTLLAGKEAALGNPAANGYVLSSTTTGTRSWVPGGASFGSLTGTPGDNVDLAAALAAKEAALGNPAANGYVLSSTTTGTRSWVPGGASFGTLTGVPGDNVDLAAALAAKEAALGNPASNGYVLSSTTTGTRSWVPGGASFGTLTGVPGDNVDLAAALAAKEATLGNPAANGYVLSSTTTGTRSWVASGASFGTLTGVPGDNVDLAAALAAKAASGANTDITSLKAGVIVLKSTGAAQFYPPSADTDTARWTSFLAANTAAASGDTVFTCPGSFQIYEEVSLKANVRYEFGKSRFYVSTGVASVYYFTIHNADDVTISGGHFDGASVGIGYGCFKVSGTSRRTRILHGTFTDWEYSGSSSKAAIDLQAVVTYMEQSALVDGCFFEDNYQAIYISQDYTAVTNCSISGGTKGITFNQAGYSRISDSNVCETSSFGIYVKDGADIGPTIIEGCTIARNSGMSIQVVDDVTKGCVISDCRIYANSSTSGYVDISGAGVSILGGILDAPLSNAFTVAGRGRIVDVFIPGSYASMGLTGANRRKFVITGCHTSTGQWSHNDLQTYTYADNTAAAAAGLEVGRQYKTSTGDVRIVY